MKNALVGLLSLVALSACSDTPDSEQQLRSLIDEVEAAAEDRDLSDVLRHVSKYYADRRGNDRQAIANMLRLRFIQHEHVHLLMRIDSIRIAPDDQSAWMTVFVGMAGRPVDQFRLAADAWLVELKLVRDGNRWQVISANWQRSADRR